MAYLLQFGSYVFGNTMRPASSDQPTDLAEQELPRAPGSASQILRRQSRTLVLRGEAHNETPATLHATLEAIKAAVLSQSGVQRLFHGRDDRFYNAQLNGITEDWADGKMYGLLAGLQLTFKATDPDALGASSGTPITTTATLATSGNTTVSNAGTSNALPVWTLTVSTGGTGTIVLTNSTTGEVATVSGTFATSDVIVLTRKPYAVTKNGTALFGLLTSNSRIPILTPGNNVVNLAFTGGLALSAAAAAYAPRYL